MNQNIRDIADEISNLTLMEVSDLVHALEFKRAALVKDSPETILLEEISNTPIYQELLRESMTLIEENCAEMNSGRLYKLSVEDRLGAIGPRLKRVDELRSKMKQVVEAYRHLPKSAWTLPETEASIRADLYK